METGDDRRCTWQSGYFPKGADGAGSELRVSPVGVVEVREHIIIILDMTFEERDGHGGGVGECVDGLV